MDSNHIFHERSRSYSGGWNSAASRFKQPQIATVLPVSKSYSEDDLLKISLEKNVPRVVERLKVQDLSLLKKDSLIGELEKCLEELESKQDDTQQLADVYERVEYERNELLDELDIAFQDLQEYMKRQKHTEDDKVAIETEREELIKENEYLKAVLSHRQEIDETKLHEQNRILNDRVKEIERKNTEYLDEINYLQGERLTLISSLVNLNSDQVNDVIKKKSRTSSMSSLASLGDDLQLLDEGLARQADDLEEQFDQGIVDVEAFRKVVGTYKSDNEDLKRGLVKVKRERDEAEREIDQIKEDQQEVENLLSDKKKELNAIKEERNEKNLTLSKLNLEKRTLQRQVDHLRETSRASTVKIATLKKELDDVIKEKDLFKSPVNNNVEENLENSERKFNKQMAAKEQTIEEMKVLQKNYENEIQTLKSSQQLVNAEFLESEKKLKTDIESVRSQKEILRKQSVGDKSMLTKNKNNADKKYKLLNEKYENKVIEFNELNEKYEVKVTEYNSLNEKYNTVKCEKCEETIAAYDSLTTKYEEKMSEYESYEEENIAEFNSLNQKYCKKVNEFNALSEKYEKKIAEYNDLFENVEIHTKEYEIIKDSLDHLNKEHKLSEKQLNNQVNILEIENTKLKASKEVLEKMLRTNEENYNKVCDVKNTLEHALKEKDSHVTAEKEECSQTVLTTENKFQTLQNEYEILLKKCKEFEKNVGKMSTLFEENKKLKLSHEKVVQKNNVCENEKMDLMKTKENDREKYSSLLVKYDNLCQDHNILKDKCKNFENIFKNNKNIAKKNDELSKEKQALNDEVSQLLSTNQILQREIETSKGYYVNLSVKYDNLCRKHEELTTNYDNLCVKEKQLNNNYDGLLKENQKLVEANYELEKYKQNNSEGEKAKEVTEHTSLIKQKEELSTKMITLSSENEKLRHQMEEINNELKAAELSNEKTEKDYKYILKSHRQEAQMNLDLRQTEIEQEKHTVKVKYELLRVEHEKLKKEKEQLNFTLESMKHENDKLNIQVQKLRLCSNSTHDVTIQRLRDDNDVLDKKFEVLHTTLNQVNTENKNLLDRIKRSDESMTTTLRSLKVRKNELQSQVEKLKHENQMLQKYSVKPTSNENVNKQIEELKQDSDEYLEKLKESENLLYELQQALAKANDLAMQKSLEGTKTKRNLEKKLANLHKENIELRRKLFNKPTKTLDQVSSTPSSTFSQKPIDNLKSSLTLDLNDYGNRKQSLPIVTGSLTNVNFSSPTSSAAKYFNLEKQQRSKSVPHSPRLSNNSHSRVSMNDLYRSSSGELSDIPDSPKLVASRQAEYDLSQQLKELLQLTDDITSGKPSQNSSLDRLNISEDNESIISAAPPVPPLPSNYNAAERRKSIERQQSFKRQLEQLQEQQEYQQQQNNSEDVHLENLNVSTDNEHWV